jgi:hypothetical protein
MTPTPQRPGAEVRPVFTAVGHPGQEIDRALSAGYLAAKHAVIGAVEQRDSLPRNTPHRRTRP